MFDLILRGGEAVDGTGAPRRRVDIAVKGDRIAGLLTPGEGGAVRELSCDGLCVCPGFLDTHSHSDLQLLKDPDVPVKLRQGITLEVIGQDGLGAAPVRPADVSEVRRQLAPFSGERAAIEWSWRFPEQYFASIQAARPAPNVAYLMPHGAIRRYVMGMDDRSADDAELYAMSALLEAGLTQGALGLSTGLIYPPCCYAPLGELITLGRICARFHAPIVVHMRSEGDRILEAVEEVISVARESACPVHISHLKIAGQENWQKLEPLLQILEAARRGGSGSLSITADQYPYTDEILSQSEEVIVRLMRLPYVNGCTDGFFDQRPHPRLYGTFPRYLGRYGREEKILSLEELIAKLTGQAAAALKIPERGTIAEKFFADLVVFDPATIEDRATFDDPQRFPVGIEHVIVNGISVIEAGKATGARPGRIVRRV